MHSYCIVNALLQYVYCICYCILVYSYCMLMYYYCISTVFYCILLYYNGTIRVGIIVQYSAVFPTVLLTYFYYISNWNHSAVFLLYLYCSLTVFLTYFCCILLYLYCNSYCIRQYSKDFYCISTVLSCTHFYCISTVFIVYFYVLITVFLTVL